MTVDTLQGIIAVVCLAAKSALIYRPRRPRQSPLYKTIESYLAEFERTCKRNPVVPRVACRIISVVVTVSKNISSNDGITLGNLENKPEGSMT